MKRRISSLFLSQYIIQTFPTATKSFILRRSIFYSTAMSPPSLTSLDDAKDSAVDTSHFLAKIHSPWKLFPTNSYNDLLRNHGKESVKVIHIVRHAEGTHNVTENYGDPTNFDARLTPKGKEQCARLAQSVKETMPELVGNVEDIGVITSPLTRCVQTALHSFPWLAATDSGVPLLAHECIRETVNFTCDRRRTVSELAQEFPRVDFAHCDKDEDFIWDDYRNRLSDEWDNIRESGELNAAAHRALEAFGMLQERPEHHLIVCSHSAFLRCILNWGQEGGVPHMPPQILDDRQEKINHKLFEYLGDEAWERHMRSDFANCELRSFCMLVKQE